MSGIRFGVRDGTDSISISCLTDPCPENSYIRLVHSSSTVSVIVYSLTQVEPGWKNISQSGPKASFVILERDAYLPRGPLQIIDMVCFIISYLEMTCSEDKSQY